MRLLGGWKYGRWLAVLMIAGFVLYQMHIAPVTVQGVAPTRQAVVSEVMGTGTLEARISTTISPKIAGRISQTLVDQGDRVESGQLLVRLDDDELQQQVEIARANLEAAQAAIQRLNADQRRAVAVATVLANQGIDQRRFYIEGKGESDPIASNSNETGRSQNRRVEIQISPIQQG